MIEFLTTYPIIFYELSFLPILLGSVILFKNKKTDDTTPKEPNKESDYEKKYREYVNHINDEKNESNKKYQKLYARIIGKVHLRKNIPSSQSLLRKLVTRTYNHFSRRRIRYKELTIDFRPMLKGILYNYSFFYKYYYYYAIDPVNKKRRNRRMNKGEISVNAFNSKKKRIPTRYLIPSNQGLEDLWWLKGQYGQVMIFRRIFMPVIHLLFKIDRRYFPKLPGQVGDEWGNRWGSYITRFLTPRTTFVDDRWWYNKPWMFQIFDTLTANRLAVYKQRKLKQRSRFLGKYKKKVASKKRRKKIRARPKFDRVTQFIYLNFYLFRRINIHMLHRALHLNYSKYPIYKSSVRYMSHDLFSLLKQAKRTHKRKFSRNKRFRFLSPQKQTYFKDIERFRNKNKKSKSKSKSKKNKSKKLRRVQRRKIGLVHHYLVKKLRKQVFRKTPTWLKIQTNVLLKQWLKQNQVLDSIRNSYLLNNRLANYRLDFTMASYAILFPNKFKEMFHLDLTKLKKRRNNYINYLLKDPYGIQKVGSAFFYFVAPFNPIKQREQLLLKKEKPNFLNKIYSLSNWAIFSESVENFSQKITQLKKEKASDVTRLTRLGVQKIKNKRRAIFDVNRQKQYNYVNFLNSLFKASILLNLSKLTEKKQINQKLKKELPFYFLSSPLGLENSITHFKVLYGYLFKTQQYRPFRYKKKRIRHHKKKLKRLYRTPTIRKLSSTRSKKYYKKMFKQMFVKYPGKYNPYKRYFKLKAQNNLPKGVQSLHDWIKLVKSWKYNAHESITTRYLHLPFHLKGFFLRKKLNLINTKQGLRRYRLRHALKLGRYVKRYTRSRFRVLNTKRHTLTRTSRPAIRPNQTRHSLLNNQYLFMKELVDQYIIQPTNDYYKYLTLLIQSFSLYKLPTFMLLATEFKNPIKQKEEFLSNNSLVSQFSSFFKELFNKLMQLLIEQIPIQKLNQFILTKVLNYINSFLINILFIIVTTGCFFSHFKTIRGVTFYFFYFIIKPLTVCIKTSIQKLNTLFGILMITLISPCIYAMFFVYVIIKSILIQLSLYIIHPIYSLILPIWLMTKTILLYFFNGVRIIYSLFCRNYVILFTKLCHRIYTYIYNLLFTRHIIKSYRFRFNRRKSSWLEYRTIAFYYLLITKFRPRGWRFIYRWTIFRHVLVRRRIDLITITPIHLIFKQYFARIFRLIYKAPIIYDTLLDMSHWYIWRAFFGDWVWTGYINRFRSLYFKGYDSLILAYMLYLLFSPMIFINWLLTAESFYKDVVLEFVAIPCYLIIYPSYFIYNQIYKVTFLNKLLTNTLLYSYYYLVYLFKHLYYFTILFHLIFPAYIEAARSALFAYYPRRLLRGLDYAIGLEEEAFTSYSIILMILSGLIYLFIVHVRIPDILSTGYRIMRLSTVNLSVPFALFNPNFDLKISRVPFVDYLENIFSRLYYYNILELNKRFFSFTRFWWSYRQHPVQASMDYRLMYFYYGLGNMLKLFYIRKHSYTLLADKTGLIKLKTGWKISYPYVLDQKWWEANKKVRPIDFAWWRKTVSRRYNYGFFPRRIKYNEGFQQSKYYIKINDPIRIAYLGAPKKHKIRKLKKPRYIYKSDLGKILKIESLPKKRFAGLRSIMRDYAYRSIKRGLSKTQHKYLGLRRYRHYKLSNYIVVYNLRNSYWAIEKCLNFIGMLTRVLFKIYQLNCYIIFSSILILYDLLIPNFVKNIIGNFPSMLIFKAWWTHQAREYSYELTPYFIFIRKSMIKIIQSIYLQLRYLMPTVLDKLQSFLQDCYLIVYELKQEWSYLIYRPSYEDIWDYLCRIISFEFIDKFFIKLYEVLKKGYKLIQFRLGLLSDDPFKENRHKFFKPNRNIQATEYQRDWYYKDNLSKQQEFDRGVNAYDYCTIDEMKNQ